MPFTVTVLNPRQSRFASEALTNLRVACCGGTQIVSNDVLFAIYSSICLAIIHLNPSVASLQLPHILNKHWAETLEMLRDIHHLDEVGVQVVNNFIHRVQTAELSSCHSCGIQLQTLLVIPCGHLVCIECIDNADVAF